VPEGVFQRLRAFNIRQYRETRYRNIDFLAEQALAIHVVLAGLV
jgi:hypothetical protein